MKISTKQITIGGALLAIMIASQFFKNLSVYITGPIVNLCLIIATLSVGLIMGIILSIIAPVTAFLITGAPAYTAIPLLMPTVMLGNIILCLVVWIAYTKIPYKWNLPAGLLAGAVLKALFMGAVIINCLFPLYKKNFADPEMVPKWIAKMTINMSFVTQFTTAAIAGVLAYLIWLSAGKYLRNEAKN